MYQFLSGILTTRHVCLDFQRLSGLATERRKNTVENAMRNAGSSSVLAALLELLIFDFFSYLSVPSSRCANDLPKKSGFLVNCESASCVKVKIILWTTDVF